MRYFMLCACALAGVLSGCQEAAQWDAQRIITPGTAGDRAIVAARESNQSRVRSGEITGYGNVRSVNDTNILYWFIRHQGSRAAATPRGTVVLLHPLMMDKSWFLPLGQKLAARGYDVLLPDLRGHGGSGGAYISWGPLEKRDVKAVVDDATAKFAPASPLYAAGASMGGCIAIQYAAYDERCRGVLAIAPPQGIREVAMLMMPLYLPSAIDERVKLAGQLGGFNPAEASASDAAAQLKCPIILMHGFFDMIVPMQHSQNILAAAHQPKRLVIVPLGDHITAQMVDWQIIEMIDQLGKMAPPVAAASSQPTDGARLVDR